MYRIPTYPPNSDSKEQNRIAEKTEPILNRGFKILNVRPNLTQLNRPLTMSVSYTNLSDGLQGTQ